MNRQEIRKPPGSPPADNFPENLIVDREDPLLIARSFLNWYFDKGHRTLHEYKSQFYSYTGGYYRVVSELAIRSKLYEFLDHAEVIRKTETGDRRVRFKPKKYDVDKVIDALRAETLLNDDCLVPFWFGDDSERLPASEIIVCRNGLLHPGTRKLYPLTPLYFATSGLPFPFDPGARKPKRWLMFVKELWPVDQECIDLLQEWLGYLLTHDTSQQKILLLIGPRRSGKGTIARVLRGLVGEAGFCGPTLSSFSSSFGLATLIDKSIGVVPDARLDARGTATVVERLLSISGEDILSVDRKYLSHWTGKLPTRLTILTNELPAIADPSGALAGRFLTLQMENSFYGQEDPNLSETLLRELPGILSWALEGLDRLRERGHFIQPQSAQDVIQQLEDLGSPIRAFIRQWCEVGPGYSITPDKVFKAWKKWCVSNDQRPGNKQSFGRDLKAAVLGLKLTQPRVDGKQIRTYQGIHVRHAVTRVSSSVSATERMEEQ